MSLKLTISAVYDETDRIREITLVPAYGVPLPAYTPGAHLDFELGSLGTRSYSLIDWPEQDDKNEYLIAVQREDGGDGGSQHMHTLPTGATLTSSAPKNDFELALNDSPVLLLAGGIGVTPLISMATQLLGSNRPFRFHYTARSRAVMGFGDRIASAFGNHVTLHFDDVDPLNLNALMDSQDPATHVYVCGPKGMIDAARSAMTAAGLPDTQFHAELFSTPSADDGDTAFEVEIVSSGEVFTIPPGKTIIDVLEDGGVDLMYDCQRGDCGICQTDVISGTPDHRDVVLSEAERASGKVMQICVSRAKSARLVLDL